MSRPLSFSTAAIMQTLAEKQAVGGMFHEDKLANLTAIQIQNIRYHAVAILMMRDHNTIPLKKALHKSLPDLETQATLLLGYADNMPDGHQKNSVNKALAELFTKIEAAKEATTHTISNIENLTEKNLASLHNAGHDPSNNADYRSPVKKIIDELKPLDNTLKQLNTTIKETLPQEIESITSIIYASLPETQKYEMKARLRTENISGQNDSRSSATTGKTSSSQRLN